jgi:hypothetical protein
MLDDGKRSMHEVRSLDCQRPVHDPSGSDQAKALPSTKKEPRRLKSPPI